jgi:hypothetical protein
VRCALFFGARAVTAALSLCAQMTCLLYMLPNQKTYSLDKF